MTSKPARQSVSADALETPHRLRGSALFPQDGMLRMRERISSSVDREKVAAATAG
jgi:hypothetical protein